MLTLAAIKENPEEIIRKLAKKHFDGREVIAKVLDLDKVRRSSQMELDSRLSELKGLSAQVGKLMKEGKSDEAEAVKMKVAEMKEANKKLEEDMAAAEAGITEILLSVPNTPCDMVPEGRTAEDNVVERSGGVMPDLPADPVYKGKGARLQRALISFFLDSAREAGYLEVQPPYVVNAASGYGTGQLPDKEGQMYHCNEDDLYLIPTAEVPVTNLYRDVILDEAQLPVRNTAYSACFRREAGSYGKDVRGLNRLHQFDKVEIVQIQHPDHSYESLKEMVDYVQTLVERLELPWHILRLCGGDMSFTSAITFDFEVYSAAQKRWLEVSSVSNFESYQANRLKCRFRGADKKIRLVHTLNGSALALPRIVAALLENNQTPEGIRIPKVLVPYTGFDMID